MGRHGFDGELSGRGVERLNVDVADAQAARVVAEADGRDVVVKGGEILRSEHVAERRAHGVGVLRGREAADLRGLKRHRCGRPVGRVADLTCASDRHQRRDRGEVGG